MDYRTTIPFFAVMLWACTLPHAIAQRACQTLHDEKPRKGLPYSNGGVLSDKLQFDRAQKSYFVKVFSETAQKGKSRFEQCFRYEAESENEVRNFFWPLAGIRAETLAPGLNERRSRRLVVNINQDPRDVINPVFAFENLSAETKAWAPVADSGKQSSAKSEDRKTWRLAVVTPDQIVPGLSQMLQKRDLPISNAIAYYITDATAPIFDDSYEGPNFRIEVRSYASRKGNEIFITTDVVPSGTAATKARYVMPALRALGRPEGTLTKLESYERFLKTYDQMAKEPEGHRPKWTFTQQLRVTDLVDGALFRIRHPIVIERDGTKDCFLAGSYSPLAVNFSLRDCPLFSR